MVGSQGLPTTELSRRGLGCRYNTALAKIAKLDGHQTVLKVEIARLRLQVCPVPSIPCITSPIQIHFTLDYSVWGVTKGRLVL